MMRKIVFVLLNVMMFGAIHAQQRPYYTQYILNNYLINPAVAGIENYWDIKASHRMQWVGLQDAPITTYLTIQGPVRKSDYERDNPTTFHAPGTNPRGEAYWQEYTKTENHAGVGLTIINDATGPLNRFAAYATYAYHVGIAPHTSLSGGISVGMQQMSLNTDKLSFATPVDPAVGSSGILNKIRPDISAGLWLYSRNYFIGLAAQQIVPEPLTYSNNYVSVQNGNLVPNIFLSAGYRIMLDYDFTLLPSVMFRYISPLPLGFDINAKLQYQDLIWGGASYRINDGFAAMVGVNLSNKFNIGYSYDITTSQLNTVSKGTHEILVVFLLGNKYSDWCPRHLW